jgi:hypothetical protein
MSVDRQLNAVMITAVDGDESVVGGRQELGLLYLSHTVEWRFGRADGQPPYRAFIDSGGTASFKQNRSRVKVLIH